MSAKGRKTFILVACVITIIPFVFLIFDSIMGDYDDSTLKKLLED